MKINYNQELIMIFWLQKLKSDKTFAYPPLRPTSRGQMIDVGHMDSPFKFVT